MFAATAYYSFWSYCRENEIVIISNFTTLLVGIFYPIAGMCIGELGFGTLKAPFYDFAGSTIVHSVGGWAALVSVI